MRGRAKGQKCTFILRVSLCPIYKALSLFLEKNHKKSKGTKNDLFINQKDNKS